MEEIAWFEKYVRGQEVEITVRETEEEEESAEEGKAATPTNGGGR